jgi:hypothetical protein
MNWTAWESGPGHRDFKSGEMVGPLGTDLVIPARLTRYSAITPCYQFFGAGGGSPTCHLVTLVGVDMEQSLVVISRERSRVIRRCHQYLRPIHSTRHVWFHVFRRGQHETIRATDGPGDSPNRGTNRRAHRRRISSPTVLIAREDPYSSGSAATRQTVTKWIESRGRLDRSSRP